VCVSPLVISYPALNSDENTSKMTLHLAIIESQELNSKSLDECSPFFVILNFPVVGITIDFYCKQKARAEEIDNEVIYWLLPMKIISHHLLSLQLIPQNDLCEGAVVSEVSCQQLELGIIWYYSSVFQVLSIWMHTPLCSSTAGV